MLRKIVRWVISTVIGEAAQLFVWPFVPTAVIGIMGWLQGIPWFYFAVGVMVAFAASVTFLVQFSQWRYRSSAANKLQFHSAQVNRSLDQYGRAEQLSIGVNLQNNAIFPIHYRMVEMSTQFLDRVPAQDEYEKNESSVPPLGRGWFNDHWIDIPPQPEGASVGYLRTRIEYGKSTHFGNSLVVNLKVFITFNAAGDVVWVQWSER